MQFLEIFSKKSYFEVCVRNVSYIYIYKYVSYSSEKATPLSKKYFDIIYQIYKYLYIYIFGIIYIHTYIYIYICILKEFSLYRGLKFSDAY